MSFIPKNDESKDAGQSSSSWADMMENEEKNKDGEPSAPVSAASETTEASETEKLSKDVAKLKVAGSSSEASAAQEEHHIDKAQVSQAVKKSMLVDIEGETLEVQAADPNSPLHSVKTFEELAHLQNTLPIPESVLKAITEMGFKQPSKIQESALPLLLKTPVKSRDNPKGKAENLIFQSQPGTGKTAAFTINMLSRCDPQQHHPQALYTSPTFNLCQQTSKVIEQMAKYTGLKVGLVYAEDRDPNGQQPSSAAVSKGRLQEQIVCGTLGKLASWIKLPKKKQRFDPAQIMLLVIDEADKLLDQQNSRDEIIKILQCLPDTVQLVFLSATFEPKLLEFAKKYIPHPRNVITLPRQEVALDNIKQLFMKCQGDQGKYESLEAIYESIDVGQAIIFVNKREKAYGLAEQMHKDGYQVNVLTGGKDMDKATQQAVLTRFREGKDKVLIATDVLARGIDVSQISLVVNFDIPVKRKVLAGHNHAEVADPETYIHRIGRTGRFGKKGTAITLLDLGQPWELEYVKKIADHWDRPIEELSLNPDEIAEKAASAEAS